MHHPPGSTSPAGLPDGSLDWPVSAGWDVAASHEM
jgi:hypothetical protein